MQQCREEQRTGSKMGELLLTAWVTGDSKGLSRREGDHGLQLDSGVGGLSNCLGDGGGDYELMVVSEKMASMAVVVFVMAVRRRKKTGETERAQIGNGGAAGVRLGASTDQRHLRCYGDGGLLGAHGAVAEGVRHLESPTSKHPHIGKLAMSPIYRRHQPQDTYAWSAESSRTYDCILDTETLTPDYGPLNTTTLKISLKTS
ncbi:hypothetical protein M0R45_006963 [Rubus argutus]|uniref:Uncharacterized protein n=1 Tax=Rubus argutus TaxID=59490 RepID=A0AAW1YS42_RUBAR